MKTLKILSFVIGIPIYIFSALFLFISIIGFGWYRGIFNFVTLLSLGLLALATYLFRKISKTDKKYVLLISIVILFISLFSSFSIIFSSTR